MQHGKNSARSERDVDLHAQDMMAEEPRVGALARSQGGHASAVALNCDIQHNKIKKCS